MPFGVKERRWALPNCTPERAFYGRWREPGRVDLTASLLARGEKGVLAALENRSRRARGAGSGAPWNQIRTTQAAPEAERGANASMVAEMHEHGIDAGLAQGEPAAPLHLKAAIVDGRLFLDDRNWLADGRDTIVTTRDVGDAAAVRAAMRGKRGKPAGIAVRKREALALEADTIRRAGSGGVAVESESFGSGVVADALLERAKAGEAVRLLVSSRDIHGEREAWVLERLGIAGAEVRVESGDRDEKLCVAGDCA